MAPPEPEPAPARVPETQPPAASPPAPEEADLTWEDKEDKLDAENIQPDPPEPTATDKKYQYKEGGSPERWYLSVGNSVWTMILSHLRSPVSYVSVDYIYVCFVENEGVAFYLIVPLLIVFSGKW